MITAAFQRDSRGLCILDVGGHAGFAQWGEDIVCAAVTSAVQLTANGITQVLGVDADVAAGENHIRIALSGGASLAAFQMMDALYLHLDVLQQQYPQNITITASEVE